MNRLLLALSIVTFPIAVALAQSTVKTPAPGTSPTVIVTPGAANKVLAVDGSAGAPSIAFASAPTYGFYKNTNRFDVTVGGQAQVSFDASGTNRQLALLNSAQLCWSSSSTPGNTSDLCFSRVGAGEYGITGVLFASLGTPANGTFAYCSDCTIANPCAGAGTGALAKRLNGVWVCS